MPYIILCAGSILLFFLSIHEGHAWGDDFAQYLKEAENIANGRPFYQSNYIFNQLNTDYAPPQYPPGYPLMLAPMVKIFGFDIKMLLYFNTLFYAALLFTLYVYFKKHISSTAATCCALIIVFSHFMVQNKGHLLSDVPCMLFVVLYLTLRNKPAPSAKRILLLIFIGTMCLLIRSQSIILVLSEAALGFISITKSAGRNGIRWKLFSREPSLKIVTGTLLLFMFLNLTMFQTPQSTLVFYKSLGTTFSGNIWHTIGENANYLITLFLSFFDFDTNDFFWKAPVMIFQYAFLVLAIPGMFLSLKRGLTIDDIFFGAMCLFILIFPMHQGARFIIVIIPIYLLYAGRSANVLLNELTRKKKTAVVLSTLFYMILGYDTFEKAAKEKCAYCIPSERDQKLFNYINTHLSPEDIVVFSKPRALALYCRPKFMNIAWQVDAARNKRQFDKVGAKYFLTGFDDMGYITKYLDAAETITDSVNIVEGFTLYHVR